MSGRVARPLDNQHVPFSPIQHHAQDAVERPFRAIQPIDQYDRGSCCWEPLITCIRNVCEGIWECIREIFLACSPSFARPVHFNSNEEIGEIGLNLEREVVAPETFHIRALINAEKFKTPPAYSLPIHNPPTTLLACEQEVLAYANAWDRERLGQDKLPQITPNTVAEGLKKYLAFIQIGRFEYSSYLPSYRGYYFAVIRRDVRLLTIELLKWEEVMRSSSGRDECAEICSRIYEALKEIGIAGATGCDPQKSTVTFQQWKNVSQRVDVFETILQNIQAAKLAIFTRRVKGVETIDTYPAGNGAIPKKEQRFIGDIDRSLWGTHCRNWIYANFGVEYGLCSIERVATAERDGYIHSPAVTNLVGELIALREKNQMRPQFRQEFTKEYLADALLNAVNMDEYPKPYQEALQSHCKEIHDDPKLWDKYMQTVLSPRGTSYIFMQEAVDFFLRQTNENKESLEIDWGDDVRFWNFIQNRIPAEFDGVSQEELNSVNPTHLLRLWNVCRLLGF